LYDSIFNEEPEEKDESIELDNLNRAAGELVTILMKGSSIFLKKIA